MSMRRRIDESTRIVRGDVTVVIKADPIEMELDPVELGKEPAEAMARVMSDAIKACDLDASPATIQKRRAKGISSTKKWSATGGLADLRAVRHGNGYQVVAPSDRLQTPELQLQLAADIPEVDDPTQSPRVRAAMERAADAAAGRRR